VSDALLRTEPLIEIESQRPKAKMGAEPTGSPYVVTQEE